MKLHGNMCKGLLYVTVLWKHAYGIMWNFPLFCGIHVEALFNLSLSLVHRSWWIGLTLGKILSTVKNPKRKFLLLNCKNYFFLWSCIFFFLLFSILGGGVNSLNCRGAVSGFKHWNYGGSWTCCLITSLGYWNSFGSLQIVGIY